MTRPRTGPTTSTRSGATLPTTGVRTSWRPTTPTPTEARLAPEGGSAHQSTTLLHAPGGPGSGTCGRRPDGPERLLAYQAWRQLPDRSVDPHSGRLPQRDR